VPPGGPLRGPALWQTIWPAVSRRPLAGVASILQAPGLLSWVGTGGFGVIPEEDIAVGGE
jgi:hypothetical protein